MHHQPDHLGNVTSQNSLGLVIQTGACHLRNMSIVLLICLLQVSTDPSLEVRTGLGPGVLRRGADRVQGSETNTERHLINVYLSVDIVLVSDVGRKFEELQQCVDGETPALLRVFCGEGFRVGNDFGEGEHSCLAVQGPGELLSILKNHVEIYGGEEAGVVLLALWG